MSDDDGVTATKLDNGLWVWIFQHDNGAYLQSPKHYRRKADALKAGKGFAQEF